MHPLKLTPFMTFLKRKQLFLSIVLLIKLNVESDFTNGKNSTLHFWDMYFCLLKIQGFFPQELEQEDYRVTHTKSFVSKYSETSISNF